ncbi:hypothetical protein H4R35_004639 [Dimargaris xerosporica]|nr:hypothetical protein H4R35_004639 [Dimargaris xerosporica]
MDPLPNHRDSSPFDDQVVKSLYAATATWSVPKPSLETSILPTPNNSSPVHRPSLLSDLGICPGDEDEEVCVDSSSDDNEQQPCGTSNALPTSADAFSAWLQRPCSPKPESDASSPLGGPPSALGVQGLVNGLLMPAQPQVPTFGTSDQPPMPMLAEPLRTKTIVGDRVNPIIVGRGRRSTLDLTRLHRQVSRLHAYIRWDDTATAALASNASPMGRFKLEIKGRNGVKVDGHLYPAETTIPLLDGQVLDFVGVCFTFRYPPPSPSASVSNDKPHRADTVESAQIASVASSGKGEEPRAIDPVPNSSEIFCRAPDDELSLPASEPHLATTPAQESAIISPADALDSPPAAVGHDTGELGESSLAREVDSVDLLSAIIDAVVFSAKRSHTVSDIYHTLAENQPHVFRPAAANTDSVTQAWRQRIQQALSDHCCFGRVARSHKDAANQVVEDLWYYDPNRDQDPTRRASYGGIVRTARRCTLKDTQYYFKPVPKHKPLKKWVYVQEPSSAKPKSRTSSPLPSQSLLVPTSPSQSQAPGSESSSPKPLPGSTKTTIKCSGAKRKAGTPKPAPTSGPDTTLPRSTEAGTPSGRSTKRAKKSHPTSAQPSSSPPPS